MKIIKGNLKDLGANGGYYYTAPMSAQVGDTVVCGSVRVKLTLPLEGEYGDASTVGIVAVMGRSSDTVACTGTVII